MGPAPTFIPKSFANGACARLAPGWSTVPIACSRNSNRYGCRGVPRKLQPDSSRSFLAQNKVFTGCRKLLRRGSTGRVGPLGEDWPPEEF